MRVPAATRAFLDEGGGERVALAAIELRTGSPIHQLAEGLDGLSDFRVFGDYGATVPYETGPIDIYSNDDLELVSSIPYPAGGATAALPLRIVVYDAERSMISAYA